jgi:hypothetical protein
MVFLSFYVKKRDKQRIDTVSVTSDWHHYSNPGSHKEMLSTLADQ